MAVYAPSLAKRAAADTLAPAEMPAGMPRSLKVLAAAKAASSVTVTTSSIMYGKANPVDALDIIGEFVRDIHGKDGCYPTNGRELGKETPLGEGRVNYPQFISRLKEIGYDGTITIEREISGDKQISDIKNAKEYLNSLIN